MQKKKIFYLIGLIFTLSYLLSIGQAKAHNPSDMILDYDENLETLRVTITHPSENLNTHYIFEVIVIVDGVLQYNQSYSSQPNTTFTYYFYIDSSPLEILKFRIEVSARCTQDGSITRSITVLEPEGSLQNIPGYEDLWITSCVGVITLILYKKRKLKR